MPNCYATDPSRSRRLLRPGRSILSAALAVTILALPGFAANGLAADEEPQARLSVVIPMVDAERGRRLFVTKGCVICHATNGVGGGAAPRLDAAAGTTEVQLLGFVARMWRGASAMLELQEIELGYQIELNAQEIGDLAAFAADGREQARFTLDQIPVPLRDLVLEEPYWEDETWPDDLLDRYFDFDGATKL